MWKLTIKQTKKGEKYPLTDKVEFVDKDLQPLADIITALANMEGEHTTEYKIERLGEE
jgi:hypothetical protein